MTTTNSDINQNENELTDAEANLYDRQIRLWGLRAQNKIRSSHIVVINASSGSASETIKNLALAGVGELTLYFNGNEINERDHLSGSNAIFIHSSDQPNSLIETYNANLQSLNPNVKLNSKIINDNDLINDFRTASLVLICDDLPSNSIKYFNLLKDADNDIPFYGIGSNHLSGYVYINGKCLIDDGQVIEFPNLSDMLESKPGLNVKKERERRDLLQKWRGWILIQSYWSFIESNENKDDFDKFYNVYFIKKLELTGLIPSPTVLPFSVDEIKQIFPSLSYSITPVHAVIGGFAAQDIIQTISGKKPGSNQTFNWLSFDGITNIFHRLIL